MAFTSDFDGVTLPAEWSFSSALGDGSVTVSDSRAHITCPSASSHDSFSGLGTPDNTVGFAASIPDHGGDIDIAVQVDTDVSDRRGEGINLLGYNGDASSAVRFAWFKATADGYLPWFYGYSRAGGADGTMAITEYGEFLSGQPSWMRLRYVASTGAWTALHSVDGHTWTTAASGTRSMTVTTFKVGVNSTSGYTTVPVRINKTVDVLAAGTTDLRDPTPNYDRVTVASITGAEGTLPAGFVDESAGTSTLTLTGSALRLTHDTGQDNTPVTGGKFRAALGWTGTRHEQCGLLFKLTQIGAGNSLCFLAPALGYPDVGGQPWDQYIQAGGYGLEINSGSTIRRPLRIDNPWDADVNVTSYPTGLDETPYCWLADLNTGINTESGPIWVRLERTARGFRAREWADGASEPSTWALMDAQDQVEDSALGPYISLSHNANPGAGSCVFDVTNLVFYRLVASSLLASTALLGV